MSVNVKLTNPTTCRAVYAITKDPNHCDTCPIMMDKDIWLSIRASVMLKKQETPDISSLFGDMFGSNNPFGK